MALKVLLVITKGETGGAQTHVQALCQSLANRVDCVVAIGGDGPASALGQKLASMGVQVLALPALSNSMSPLRILAAVRALLALMDQTQPDVVHAHSAVAGVVARIAAHRSGLPVIYTVHGFAFKPEAPALQRWLAWLTEWILAPWTDHMVCVSEYERQLAARLPLPSARVSVVFNAVSDPAPVIPPVQEPLRVMMVARMAPPKRPDLLLQALALLRQRLGYELPATLVGDGPELKVHQDLCLQLGLQEVTFTGNVTDVAQRLQQHAIFVLMSDHEGLPISVLEAMRAGLAVVASKLPGLQELIEDGRHGLLVANQAPALADQLQALVQQPQLRQNLGQAAQQRVAQRFTPQHMVEPILALYQRLGQAKTVPEPAAPAQLRSLSSTTAQLQRHELFWSFSGVLVLLVSYAIALGLQQAGWVTYQFAQTVLWCALPYLVAAHWLYRGAVLPGAERLGLLLVSTTTPFVLTPLGFALLQQPYSRGAVLLVYLLSGAWFMTGSWLRKRQPAQQLAYLDADIPRQLAHLIGANAADAPSIRLVPWEASALQAGQMPDCEGVVLDTNQAPSQERLHLLSQLKLNHIRLYTVAAVAELCSGRKMLPEHDDAWWQMDGNPAYDLFKRSLDLVVVLLALPLWLPVCGVMALLVKLDSPGPALYSQSRVGHDGRSFRLWKLRSMQHQRQAPSANFTLQQDHRITRVGRFIRRWKFDELPQLWNVLRGDMSLIGPRPEQTQLVNDFARQIPAYPYRHLVRPGLTGWAQVQQGYADGEDATMVKLSYDLYYVAHYSMALDLLIAYKTVRTVLSGFGGR